jgi:predicted transposase/invertase (TIGR01784 family)
VVLIVKTENGGFFIKFDKFGICFFELPKFRKTPYNQSEPHTMLEMWTVFLSEQDEEKLENIAMQEHSIKQAYEKLKHLSSDKEMQYLYHMERMREIGIKTDLRVAEAKGKVEGKVEGKKEANFANARKMKAKGLSVAEIMEFTELTEEEIKAL